MDSMPKIAELIEPLLRVLSRGTTLSNDEIRRGVIQELLISEEVAEKIHSGKRSELEYRLAWARTRAKGLGLIEPTSRNTWRITDLGRMRLQSAH
jgi:restriction system protein